MRLIARLLACLPLVAGRRPAVGMMRGVLMAYLLSLGVAIASPIVHPRAIELVCSSVGQVKAVVQTDGGAQELGASHLDCPLCTLTGAPPRPMAQALPPVLPPAHAVQPIHAAHIAAATAAPLPARGPPSLA